MTTTDRAAILGVIALLTWILFKGFSLGEVRVREAIQAVDTYQAAESALHRDVLSARAGILRNYDPLAADVEDMNEATRQVRGRLQTEHERRQGDALLDALRQQEAITEQFKSRNALMQNSLAYFGLFTARLSDDRATTGLRREIDGVSSAMLNLSLTGDRTAARVLGVRLEALQRRCRATACGSDVHGLVRHGQLLGEILPEVAGLIERLVRTSGTDSARELNAALLVSQRAAEDSAGRYRVLLYLGSVLLAYLLVRVFMQVRAHAATLRNQVALEHAVAGISTRLIAASPQKLDSVVHDALGELTGLLGATCAWFRLAPDNRNYLWPLGKTPPPGCWAESLVQQATSHDQAGYGVVEFTRQGVDRDSLEFQVLETAGAESCYCIVRPGGAVTRNVLAFAFARGVEQWASAHLAVLSAALDAISMALEHAKLEEERGRLEAQLGQTRRMETVGAFASGIAHNFNNLLGAISGHVEMAANSDDGRDAPDGHIEQIRLSAERGRQLVQGLLTFGRRYEHHRQATDLGALLTESRGLAEAALAAGHTIVLSLSDPDLAVLADPPQLQQVILNLCHNAAQAMAAGGSIRITLAQHDLVEPHKIGDRTLPPGGYAVISIADTGWGIPPALLRKVYEPFFTTKASGTGLGLSTAREIVSEQGGALMLDSVVGQGTTATIWLPLIAHEVDEPAVESPIQGDGEVVLLVAASELVRMRTEELLAALGYEPVGFATAAAAAEALRKAPTRFDAMLVGDMPLDIETTALLDTARALAPEMPRIFSIMHAADHHADRLVDVGITNVVQFPPEPREVAMTLGRLLASARQTAQAYVVTG